MIIKDKIFQINHRKPIKIPVLLICFDRPKILNKTIKLLLNYNVENLYIFQDGYLGEDKEIIKRHTKVKSILNRLRNKKKIKLNSLKKNYGKQFGPPKAIDWFFKKVTMGVIIEDDTLPSKSFLLMSQILLNEHKNDKKVFQICGSGVLPKSFGNITYSSSLPFIHGWATWRNRWKLYNQKIGNLNKLLNNKNFIKNVDSFIGKIYWLNIFSDYKKGRHLTWDYPLAYHCITKNYECIKPSFNMVTNIGYKKKNKLSLRKKFEINYFHNLKHHSTAFINEKKAEEWIFYNISLRYKISLITKFIIKKINTFFFK